MYLRLYRIFIACSPILLKASAQSCGSACPYYSLAFSDEFNNVAINSALWNYRTDAKGESVQLAANVVESGGYAVINLKQQMDDGFNYTGGGLISKANFQYGYYEARMKLNNGQGWHSSFWLMAGDGSTTISTATGNHTEIDIFEFDSISPNNTRHNIFKWDTGFDKGEVTTGITTTPYDFRDFHVWGGLWTETGVAFYIDGVLQATLPYGPMVWTHDYVNIWLTTIAYVDKPVDSLLPAAVDIDYIHYYQKDFYLTAGSLCHSKWQGTTPCPSNVNYTEPAGTWSTSSLTGYTSALATRYACSQPGATASWSKQIPYTGTYVVSIWIIARSDSDPAAVYSIYRNGALVTSKTVSQTTGALRWGNIAESIAINAGDDMVVKMVASGTGCARADTVRYQRLS